MLRVLQRASTANVVAGEVLLPGHPGRRLVEALGAARLDLAERVEHAHRDPRPQGDAERLAQVGVEAHAAAVLLHLRRAQLGQLRGEEVLGPRAAVAKSARRSGIPVPSYIAPAPGISPTGG